MGATRYHVAVNIKGLLLNYRRKKMVNLLIDEDGHKLSDTEARQYLKDCLSEGMKYIPNHECEGFDPFENGCPGHRIN
jgi:hypothetical protein